ncbi:MAG: OsmC family protein [Acidimicrobiia bacterium]|nr:OsmC family protein [Acidimicrobiia bacterium]
MTTSTRTSAGINAVDIDRVAGLANKIQESPEVASTVWKATVSWDEGFRSTATIRDFGPIASDEPTGLGGTDTAPNPVEQLLGSLGNCLAVGYAANATAAGIVINNLTIDLEGDLDLRTFLGLDPEGNAGYEGIRVNVDLDADATPDELAALHRKVVGTSPVGDTLTRAVPVQIELA